MENLKALGQAAKQPNSPEEAELERVPNPHPDCNFVARFTQPEFTSLCPVTAQPDFAHLIIDYIPDQWMVESKSLKLYLGSFRNHQAFHEAFSSLFMRNSIPSRFPDSFVSYVFRAF